MRTNNNFDFPNPYTEKMAATWFIPKGYGDEEQETALLPWASHLVKAMDLYNQGQYMEALGVGFEALDKLAWLCSHDKSFFYSSTGDKRYAAELIDVTLYVICKTYSAKELSAEAKQEVCDRLEDYYIIYKKAVSHNISTGSSVEEFIRKFRSKLFADIFNSFFDITNNEEEESNQLSQEEQLSLTKNVADDALSIKDYTALATEEIFLLSRILTNLYLQEALFHDGIASEALFETCLDKLGEIVSSRMKKATDLNEKAILFNAANELSRADTEITGFKEFVSHFVNEVISAQNVDYSILHVALDALQSEPLTEVIEDSKGRRNHFSTGKDFFETTLQQWASTQNTNGSWPDVSADEAYGRIRIIGHDFGSVKGVDNRYVIDMAYDFYSQTPSHTPIELYEQFTTYKSKWGNNRNDKDFKVQAMQMLHAEPLPLADRLRLQYILCR